MDEREIALKYAPHLYFDKNEPFTIAHIGYSILKSSQKSPSANHDIWIDGNQVDYVIEYQLYYDFDIQHMYDLEHVWIYVGHDGKIVDGEASAHGGVINCYKYTMAIEDETHLPVYVQPGKHAHFPDGNMFKLYGNYEDVCNKLAGIDGLLITDVFKGAIIKNSYIDFCVCNYIREHFSFQPSLEFRHVSYDNGIVMTWEELYLEIPKRISRMLVDMGLSLSLE